MASKVPLRRSWSVIPLVALLGCESPAAPAKADGSAIEWRVSGAVNEIVTGDAEFDVALYSGAGLGAARWFEIVGSRDGSDRSDRLVIRAWNRDSLEVGTHTHTSGVGLSLVRNGGREKYTSSAGTVTITHASSDRIEGTFGFTGHVACPFESGCPGWKPSGGETDVYIEGAFRAVARR